MTDEDREASRARKRAASARHRVKHPEAAAAACARYRAKHPEAAAAAQARYREKHPDGDAQARYRANHPEAVAATQTAWRKRNPEKMAAKKARYYLKHREAIRAKRAAYREKNRELIRAQQRVYREKNRQKLRDKQKIRWPARYAGIREQESVRKAQFRKQNLMRLREGEAVQRALHPEVDKARVAGRRARKRGSPGQHSAADIKDIRSAQSNRCAYCRGSLRKGMHVDHIIPLSKGGSNDRRNVQLTCGLCNMKKHDTDPIVFAQRLGRLL